MANETDPARAIAARAPISRSASCPYQNLDSRIRMMGAGAFGFGDDAAGLLKGEASRRAPAHGDVRSSLSVVAFDGQRAQRDHSCPGLVRFRLLAPGVGWAHLPPSGRVPKVIERGAAEVTRRVSERVKSARGTMGTLIVQHRVKDYRNCRKAYDALPSAPEGRANVGPSLSGCR